MPPPTRLSADRIAQLLSAAVGPTDGPTLLHDRAAVVVHENGMASDLDEALELVEPFLEDVKVRIFRIRELAEAQGVAWTIELYGSSDEFVRGSSFEDPTLSREIQRVRANRAHVVTVAQLLRALTPVEFEGACTQILRIMGCVEPKTSPLRNDGGIDFYGRLELKGRLDSILPYGGIDGRAGVWLIGQAKHYPTSAIQTAHLRELVGSVELARTGGAIHQWEGLSLRPFDATLMLIFTTGRFSAGAHQLLAQSGMLAMDGAQLATFLCDASVGFADDGSGFDPDLFRQGLLEQSLSTS